MRNLGLTGLGVAALVGGLAKIQQHTASALPFEVSWCGPEGVTSTGLFWGHCWGCPVALAGGLLLLGLALTGIADRVSRPPLRTV